MKKTLSSLLILGSLFVIAGCSEVEKIESKENVTKEEVVAKENKVVSENHPVKQEEVFFNDEDMLYFDQQGEKPNDYGLHLTPLNYVTLHEVSNKAGKVTKAKEGNVFLAAEFKVENKSKTPIKIIQYLTSPMQITFDSGYTYQADSSALLMGYEYVTGIESSFIDILNPLENFVDRAVFEVNESLLQESFVLEVIQRNTWEGDKVIQLIKFEK